MAPLIAVFVEALGDGGVTRNATVRAKPD